MKTHSETATWGDMKTILKIHRSQDNLKNRLQRKLVTSYAEMKTMDIYLDSSGSS